MKIINTLLERKQDLLAEINAAMEELRAIEISLAAFKNISNSIELKSAHIVQSDLFERKPRRKSPELTIKQMIGAVLNEAESGLEANAILEEINARWNKSYVRTSLSPQLSRLKQEGHLLYYNKRWLLAEKNEASGVLPPEARDGEVFKNTSSVSIKFPAAGSSSKEFPSRKEGES